MTRVSPYTCGESYLLNSPMHMTLSGRTIVNHQKCTIFFKTGADDSLVGDIEKNRWVHTNVRVILAKDTILTDEFLDSPNSVTYDSESKVIVIGRYGLPGGCRDDEIDETKKKEVLFWLKATHKVCKIVHTFLKIVRILAKD